MSAQIPLVLEPARARRADPTTSHEAARAVSASGVQSAQARLALEAVSAHPGSTSVELAHSSPLDRYQLARRLPELERAGAVVRGAPRRCSASGRRGVTWWPR